MGSLNKKNNFIQTYLLMFFDICCILVAYIVSFRLRFRENGRLSETDAVACLVLVVLAMVCELILDWNRYIFKRGMFAELLAVCKYIIVITVMLGFAVFIFRLGNEFSRMVFGAFALIDGLLTYIVHILFKKWLLDVYRKGMSSDNVVIFTYRRYVEDIIEGIRQSGEWSCNISGIALLDVSADKEIEGVPVLVSIDGLEENLSRLAMDIAFLYAPGMEEEKKTHIIDMFKAMGITCYLSLGRHMKIQSIGQFGGHAIVAYEERQMDFKRKIVKRMFDIIGAVIGIIITVVFYPFIAIAIKIDSPGPVIFKQQRIGRNGRRFNMYKFRSMYLDAEERKNELMEQNEVDGLMFKMENDPRITKVGTFIRRTSIDELPQFINILLGDMSLIGTRPPTVEEFEQYGVYYRRRLSITPGLTGMWQVSGRSDIKDFDQVVALDLDYIDNWSLALDMKILLKTILVVFGGKGSR